MAPLGQCLWPDSGLHFWLPASSVYLLCIVDLSISYSLLSLSLAHNAHQNHCNQVSDQANVTRGHKPCPGGTPYYGLYGEAPFERSTFLMLQVCESVGISLVQEYERVGKNVISVFRKTQNSKGLTDVIYGRVKVEKTFWFVIYSY